MNSASTRSVRLISRLHRLPRLYDLVRRAVVSRGFVQAALDERSYVQAAFDDRHYLEIASARKNDIQTLLNEPRILSELDLVREALRHVDFTQAALDDRELLTAVLGERDFVADQIAIRQRELNPPPPRPGREQSHAAWTAREGDRTLRLDYALNSESLVLDVGGSQGQWAADIFTRFMPHIEIFEPDGHLAAAIAERFVRNPSVRVHAFGLGGKACEAPAASTDNASSAVRVEDAGAPAKVVSFADWHEAAGRPVIDLLKLDVDGTEYELLEHVIDAGIVEKIANIQVKFHDFVPDADSRMRAIGRRLRETHLPTYRSRYVWESWRRRGAGETQVVDLAYMNVKNPFNVLDPDFARELAEAFDLKVFIETGTYRGDTIAAVEADFESVISIELSQDLHQRAVERFSDRPNVTLLQGDSWERMSEAFGLADGRPALIWLDAHFSGTGTARGRNNTPILGELDALVRRATSRDIVIIDDLRCFAERPSSGFDAEETLEGYPEAGAIADLLVSHGYEVVVVCDALLAIPAALASRVRISPALRAATDLRLRPLTDARRREAQDTIAAATGGEAEAFLRLPGFLEPHMRYGVGGHYYHWRSLVGEKRNLDTVSADRDFARRCGIDVSR